MCFSVLDWWEWSLIWGTHWHVDAGSIFAAAARLSPPKGVVHQTECQTNKQYHHPVFLSATAQNDFWTLMDSNYDRTALIHCCILELCGVRFGLLFLPCFVLSTRFWVKLSWWCWFYCWFKRFECDLPPFLCLQSYFRGTVNNYCISKLLLRY